MNKSLGKLLLVAIIATALGSTSTSLMPMVAAQSPMDMMSMIGGGENGNMSMQPFKMGVLTMPMMCTSPADMLGMVGSMFDEAGDGTEGNATEQMAMDMMREQMMMQMGGGFDDSGGEMDANMTDAELQQVLDMVVCFPMMDETMMEGMMMGSSEAGEEGVEDEMMLGSSGEEEESEPICSEGQTVDEETGLCVPEE